MLMGIWMGARCRGGRRSGLLLLGYCGVCAGRAGRGGRCCGRLLGSGVWGGGGGRDARLVVCLGRDGGGPSDESRGLEKRMSFG